MRPSSLSSIHGSITGLLFLTLSCRRIGKLAHGNLLKTRESSKRSVRQNRGQRRAETCSWLIHHHYRIITTVMLRRCRSQSSAIAT